MKMMNQLPWQIIEGAVASPAAVARALRQQLGPHPVPMPDARTRGLLLEVAGDVAARTQLGASHPVLAAALAPFLQNPDALYLVAVNETPPSAPAEFLMRPHVDQRWLGPGQGFSPAAARVTTVVFLDFPPSGQGGELVLFPGATPAELAALPPTDVRPAVAQLGGVLVAPRPGQACRLVGALPHAVLGYAAAPAAAWRLVAVVGEFAP